MFDGPSPLIKQGQRLKKSALLLSISVTLATAVIIPSVYFFSAFNSELRQIREHAINDSRNLSVFISSHPDFWEFQTFRLEEIISHGHGDDDTGVQKVVDIEGDPIISTGDPPTPPVYGASEPIFRGAEEVGRIELEESLWPLILNTALIGGLGIIISSIVFFFTWKRSYRVVEDSLKKLDHYHEALQESEGRFKSFAETASDWFWELDQEFRIVYMSEGFSDATDSDIHWTLGKTREQLAAPEMDPEALRRHVENLKAHRPFEGFHYSYHTPEGRLINVEINGQPVFDTNGVFTGYRGTSRDISRHLLAERILKDSQRELFEKSELLQTTLDSIDQGFAVWDGQQKLVAWNEKCLDFWYNSDAVQVGMTKLDLIRDIAARGGFGPGDLNQLTEKHYQRVHASGPDSHEEFSLLDGREIFLRRFPMPTGGHASVYTDVTDRKKAERGLEKTEQTLLDVIQASPVAVGITDRDGRFLFWNSLFFKMGRQATDEKGHTDFTLSFRNSDTHREIHEQLEREGKVRNVEVKLLDGEGEETWGMIFMQNMEFEGEKSILTWVYDITNLKNQEEALTQARLEAEEANRGKSDFLAQMSHEIRTPMNGVMTMSDMLGLTELNEEQADMNRIVRESSKSLLTIINDILDFSKIEAGKIDIEKTGFSLTEVVEGVAELLAPNAFKKGLELIVCVDPQVPDHLEGDPARLRQVLTNLLGNAIKFTHTGHIVLDVALAGKAGNKSAKARFSVSDTGIGLTEEQISQLFQPFHQADSSISRRYGGTGLGLTISRALVSLMEGEIEVQSTFHEGSSFIFELPFAILDENRILMSYDLSGIHLLVVAPHPSVRKVLGTYLEHLNAQCTFAGSHTEGAAIILGNSPGKPSFDAVITDDPPCGSSEDDFLESMTTDAMLQDVSLVCTERQMKEGLFDAGTIVADNVKLVAKPYKRKLLSRTVAKAVGRAPEEEMAHWSRRVADGLELEKYTKPSVDEALDQGALILIAEDNPTNQTVIRMLMDKMGYAAEIVANGAQALERLEEKPYGLLLTDCHMPEMDGFQLTGEVRDREKKTDKRLPIVALTADALSGTSQKCLDAGMDGYLSKPVEMAALDRAIKKWLPQAPQLRRLADDQAPHRSEQRKTPEQQAPSTTKSEPVLDLDYFRALVGDSDEMLKSLLTEFVDTTRPIVDQLISALNDGDYEAARKAAHAGAGSSKTAGAIRLAGICGAVEKAIHDEDYEKALARIDEIEPALGKVADEVNAL